MYKQNAQAKERGIAVKKQMQATFQAMDTDTEYDYEEDDDTDYSDLEEYL